MREQLAAQVGQHALPHPREQILLRGGRAVQRGISQGGIYRKPDQFLTVAVGDGLIDGQLEQVGRQQRQGGNDQHGEHRQRHLPPVGTQVGQHARHHALVKYRAAPVLLAA